MHVDAFDCFTGRLTAMASRRRFGTQLGAIAVGAVATLEVAAARKRKKKKRKKRKNGCTGDTIACEGACVDPGSDIFNCGGCGIECPVFQDCLDGICTA